MFAIHFDKKISLVKNMVNNDKPAGGLLGHRTNPLFVDWQKHLHSIFIKSLSKKCIRSSWSLTLMYRKTSSQAHSKYFQKFGYYK